MSARQGWIADPPPPPPREYIPGEEHKMCLMMGARYLLPKTACPCEACSGGKESRQ
jgi:hypothetical protein